jgi:hypothetical protein
LVCGAEAFFSLGCAVPADGRSVSKAPADDIPDIPLSRILDGQTQPSLLSCRGAVGVALSELRKSVMAIKNFLGCKAFSILF